MIETTETNVLMLRHMILFEVGPDLFYLDRASEKKSVSHLYEMTDLRSINDAFEYDDIIYRGRVKLPNYVMGSLSQADFRRLATVDNYLIERLVIEAHEGGKKEFGH